MPPAFTKKRIIGGGEPRFNWVFYILFFILLFTLGLVALYTHNTELIGFGIFFSTYFIIASTIIYSFAQTGFKDFQYNKDDPKNNVIFNNHFGSIFGFFRPIFNVNIVVIFEVIMVFVSLLLMLITYGGINTLYSTFGITTITNLSDVPNIDRQSVPIQNKDNFKALLIVLTILMTILMGTRFFYDELLAFFTTFLGSTNALPRGNNYALFAVLCVYFVGSIIFLFFGYLPVNAINHNNHIITDKQQLPIKIVSVLNLFFLCIFGLFCYNYYVSHSSSVIYNDQSFKGAVNYFYIILIITIYLLSCWEVYISNDLMLHFLPSKLLDPTSSAADKPSVQGCDPNKPETCPHPGALPLQWLYSFGY